MVIPGAWFVFVGVAVVIVSLIVRFILGFVARFIAGLVACFFASLVSRLVLIVENKLNCTSPRERNESYSVGVKNNWRTKIQVKL